MKATSAARFRVIPLVVGALIGCAACAGGEGEGEAGMPSETIVPSSSHVELSDAVQDSLEDALVTVMDQYQVPGAAVTITSP